MTVADLIRELKRHDPATPVVLARDPEGNGFGELAEASPGDYDVPRWKRKPDQPDTVPALILWPE